MTIKILLEQYRRDNKPEQLNAHLSRYGYSDISFQLDCIFHQGNSSSHYTTDNFMSIIFEHLSARQDFTPRYASLFLSSLSKSKARDISQKACESIVEILLNITDDPTTNARDIATSLKVMPLIMKYNPKLRKYVSIDIILSLLEKIVIFDESKPIDIAQSLTAIAQLDAEHYPILSTLSPLLVSYLFTKFLHNKKDASLQDHSSMVWAILQHENRRQTHLTNIKRKQFRRFFKSAAKQSQRERGQRALISTSMTLWAASQISHTKRDHILSRKHKKSIKTKYLRNLARVLATQDSKVLDALPDANKNQIHEARLFFKIQLENVAPELASLRTQRPPTQAVKGIHCNAAHFLSRQGIRNLTEQTLEKIYQVDIFIPPQKGIPGRGIVIEIDGNVHTKKFQTDEFKTERLQRLGYKVIRITTDEVEVKHRLSMSPLADILSEKSPELCRLMQPCRW